MAEKRVDFFYDADGRLTDTFLIDGLDPADTVDWERRLYDERGRLRVLQHNLLLSDQSVEYDYSYDAANRLTDLDLSMDGESPIHTAYSYDDRGQLTGVDDQSSNDQTYAYDDNGNRTNHGSIIGDNNQLLFDGTYTYQYDAEGNRIRQFVDDNENEIYDAGDTNISEYAWDHRNRLVEVAWRSNFGADVSHVVDYVYDAFNQLVKRVVDPDGDEEHAAIAQAFYLYDQGQVALEFHKTGAGEAEAVDLSRRYLWNPAAVDQLLADEQVASLAAAGETLWALTDHLGTVRDLADNNGVLRKHLYYDDAFGRLAGADYYDESGELIEGMEPASNPDAVGADQRFYFTGRFFDNATGLQNNLHRWYDPQVGRWISEDPIGFGGGDANLYRYVGNSPTVYTDAEGTVAASAVAPALPLLPEIPGAAAAAAAITAAAPAAAAAAGGAACVYSAHKIAPYTTVPVGTWAGNLYGRLVYGDSTKPSQPAAYSEPLPDPREVSRRQSERRRELGLCPDPDISIPNLQQGIDGGWGDKTAGPPRQRTARPPKPRHPPGERGDHATPKPPTSR